MNIQHIHNEAKRGCGYRKQGGLYLMAGAASAPCGKLPHELEKCPCCGSGFKPARGWTWIDPRPLFAKKPCEKEPLGGGGLCILDDVSLPERMGLLWVGEKFYATPADFLKEGAAQGLSRRINAIPHGFEIGKTFILFAHRKGLTQYCAHPKVRGEDWGVHPDMLTDEQRASCPDCKDGIREVPAIFSAFRPTRIEYVVKDDDDSEKLEQMEMRGITLVRLTWDADHNGNHKLDLEDELEFPEGNGTEVSQEELFADENGAD
jgi:hypothetical protein